MNQTVAALVADFRARAAEAGGLEYVAACGRIQAIVRGAGERTAEQRLAEIEDVLAALDLTHTR